MDKGSVLTRVFSNKNFPKFFEFTLLLAATQFSKAFQKVFLPYICLAPKIMV